MSNIVKFPSKHVRSVLSGLKDAIAYVRGDKSAVGRVTNYWYDAEEDKLYSIDENGNKKLVKPSKKTS